MLRKNLSTEDALIIHGAHGGHGLLGVDGIILGSLRLEILEEIIFKNGRGPEIIMDPRKTRKARMVNVSRKISFELYSCCLFHRSRW